MFHLVADGLAGLLRAELGLGAASLEVVFEAPDRSWAATRNQPAVNCYMWHLGPNLDQAASGMERIEIDGRLVRRPVLPRVDLRYLVTAWTDDPRDEQQLLGGVTRALLRNGRIPEAHLPEAIAHLEAPQLRLLPGQPHDRADFWTALGGSYHAGLDLLVTAQLDPQLHIELPPAPREVRLTVADREEPARRSWKVFGRRQSA